MTIAIFAISWLAIFGPKLGGFADLSMVAGLIGFLLLAKKDFLRLSPECVTIAVMVTLVLAYSLLAVLFDGAQDIQPVLRHVRSMLSSILLGLFFYNIAVSQLYSAKAFLQVMIAVLLTNAFVVLVSVFQLEVQQLLAEPYGFNKPIRPLRSFGLTAGYDSAGYLCAIGAVFSSISVYFQKNRFALLSLFVFVAASFFTSRSSMLLVSSLIAVFCVVFLLHGRWTLKAVSAVYLAAGTYIAAVYLVPLITSSFGWGGVSAAEVDFSGSFARTDLAAWMAKMWTVPDSTAELLFGTGAVIQTSDVGYIELIYMIGVLGLCLVLLIYGYMFVVTLRMRLAAKKGWWLPDTETWVLLISLIIVIAGHLVINIKNLYFLSRGFYELIVIVFFFLIGTHRVGVVKQVEEMPRPEAPVLRSD